MYVTSREVKNTKYVANFHTKAAADEYENYLKSLLGVERELVGVTRVRNSVVYTMECFKKGYTLAKQFEDDYIARMAPPAPIPVAEPAPEPLPEPEPIPEIVQVVEEPVVEEVVIEPVEPEPEAVEQTAPEELEEITEEELAQAVENFTEEPSVFEEQKSGPGPLTSKITGFFKGNNKINTN